MRLVRFERPGEGALPLYVNPEHVVTLEAAIAGDCTSINVLPTHWMYIVKGTPEETRAALEREAR